MISCIIIDDETPARSIIRHYLSQMEEIEVLDECANGFDAFKSIRENKPDLIFLDIQMPKVDGFELLELLEDDRPEVIFITAYDQHAIKAFEMNVVDYLLKPFAEERFGDAVRKAIARIQKQEQRADMPALLENINQNRGTIDRVVVKNGVKILIFAIADIRYIKAEDDYIMLYTNNGKHLKKATMSYFENRLPGDTFIRIHRSYIINTAYISKLERYGKETYALEMKDGEHIKTSKAGAKRLKDVLGF